jgi:hypothetical protein
MLNTFLWLAEEIGGSDRAGSGKLDRAIGGVSA